MSNDPATFVAGIPVKIGERFRPPRKITLPASCNHTVNVELLITEYDFVCENSTLTWLEEKRKRKEVEQQERKERIAKYEKEKADRIAKEKEEEERRLEEERERQIKIKEEEEENERIRKDEEERRIKEDEERKRIEEMEVQRKIEEEAERRLEAEKQRYEEEEKRRERLKHQVTEIENEDSEGILVQGNICNEDIVTNIEDRNTGGESSDIANETDTQFSQVVLPSNIPVNPVTQHETVSQLPPNQSQPLNLGNAYQIGSKNYSQNGYVTGLSLNNESSQNKNMLQPTQVPSQKQHGNIHNPHCINFADFEGQGSDPFDSAALKSINDMEELAKVLQESSIQQDQPTISKANTSGPSTNSYVNNQVNPSFMYGPQQYPGYAQPGMKHHSQQQPTLQSQQQQQQQQHQQVMYGGYGGAPVTTSTGQGNATISSGSSGSYSSTTQYHGTSGGTSYVAGYYNPQQWNRSYGTNSPKNPQQYTPYNYGVQTDTGVSHAGNTGIQGSLGSGTVVTASTISPAITASGVLSSVATPGKRQDLEDFYSRYYSQSHTTNMHHSGNRSVESTPGQSAAHGDVLGTGSIRSSRSVPDLTAEDDAEVSGFSKRQMGLSNGNQRAFSHTPPPRPPSTTINGIEDWKPLPDQSSINKEGLTSPQYGNSHILMPKYGLPDPFTELNSEAQGLVTSMAEMGFPRPRVARAVQKLGTDHKKLLEVLLVLQKLQEQGEDEYRSELAFYHYLGDIDKTKDHLTKTKQLQDLGFAEDKIIDALFRHSNNTDKALEELIA